MHIPLNTTLETERLILQVVSEDDVECAWTASRVSGFTDGMQWDPPETKEEVEQNIYTNREKWEVGEFFVFSIYIRNANECAGRIIIRPEGRENIWNIGYWMHPNYQGNGYTTEAVIALVEWGFSVLHAEKITSAHASWNDASGKVLQKAGFIHIGHTDCGFMKHGKEVPEELYEITRNEK